MRNFLEDSIHDPFSKNVPVCVCIQCKHGGWKRGKRRLFANVTEYSEERTQQRLGGGERGICVHSFVPPSFSASLLRPPCGG